MDRFADLGIASELAEGAASLGWTVPAGIQDDALPVLRRGNNVVLHASDGSGATGAWALGLLDRLIGDDDPSPEAGPRALVLTADADTAARVSASVARLAHPVGLAVRAEGPGWADRPADCLVLSPAAAAAAVRASELKLGALRTLVVRDLDGILETGQREDLETLADIVPPEAQRVVVTGRLTDAVASFVERHVRRALTIPPRTTGSAESSGGTRVRYRVVSEHGKAAAVIELVPRDASEVAVICRTEARATALERELEARGAAELGPTLRVLSREEADQRSTTAHVISADAPFDAGALEAVHARGGAVLVTVREREHLRRIAGRAGMGLDPLPDAGPRPGAPQRVRERLRAVLQEEDLSAELALIAPLLDEVPAAEVAAAALRMARDQSDAAPSRAPADRPQTSGRTGAPPPSAPTWTHLFVSIGDRDGVGPGDLVGAMTGEAEIQGDQVGKIDVRESHSTVEVATPVAAKVIEALNGRTLKGRSLRVDYDRKGRSSGSGGSGGRSGGSGGRSGGSGGRKPPRSGREPKGRR